MASAAATLAALLPALGASAAVAVESPENATPSDPAGRVAAEVIVSFGEGASSADRAEAIAKADARRIERLGAPGVQLLRTGEGSTVGEVIRALEADSAVEVAEPNRIERPLAIPDDTSFGQLWGLHNTSQSVFGVSGTADADIDAPEAWDIGAGDASTAVAIMDSGADLSHPDLAPQLWQNPRETANGVDDDGNGFVDDLHGADFAEGDGSPVDTDSGHGTHVAGTALARGNDGFGVTGASQRASLMVLRVCEFIPSIGGIGCTVADQIAAINYAAANGARVLNGSLGGGTTEDPIRRDAIASHPEVLHVFAAGNDGSDNDTSPRYPCAHSSPSPPVVANQVDNIVCVAATNQTDSLAGFSNFGATSVDLAAPGTNILSDSGARTRLIDDFSAPTLAWTAVGGQTNWQRSNEAPLASFGISEKQGNYDTNTTYGTLSPPVSLPAGRDDCELRYFRARALGAGDTFRLEVLLDGTVVDGLLFTELDNTGGANVVFGLGDALGGGGTVRVRLTLVSDAAGVSSGIQMDDVRLVCIDSPSDGGLELKQGTSMASPLLAGAAALLVSRNPAATTTEVREKLLGSVDPLPSLAGKTVTGGRLNLGTAMARMPADTAITSGPAEGAELGGPGHGIRRGGGEPGAVASFGFSSGDPAASFQCAVDGAAFAPCSGGSWATVGPLLPGAHSFAVRSVDPRGNVDTTPAGRSFSVEAVAPQTKIRKAPRKRTRSRKAKFTFRSSEAASSFECKLDRKRFSRCSSPRKLKRLPRKKHKFKVRAVDAVGNVDPTPAKKRWKVKKRRRR